MTESSSQSGNGDRDTRRDVDNTEEVIILPRKYNPFPLSHFLPKLINKLFSFPVPPLGRYGGILPLGVRLSLGQGGLNSRGDPDRLG